MHRDVVEHHVGVVVLQRCRSDADLARLHRMAEEYDDAYVMFNNFTMHEDARRFRGRLNPKPSG